MEEEAATCVSFLDVTQGPGARSGAKNEIKGVLDRRDCEILSKKNKIEKIMGENGRNPKIFTKWEEQLDMLYQEPFEFLEYLQPSSRYVDLFASYANFKCANGKSTWASNT